MSFLSHYSFVINAFLISPYITYTPCMHALSARSVRPVCMPSALQPRTAVWDKKSLACLQLQSHWEFPNLARAHASLQECHGKCHGIHRYICHNWPMPWHGMACICTPCRGMCHRMACAMAWHLPWHVPWDGGMRVCMPWQAGRHVPCHAMA